MQKRCVPDRLNSLFRRLPPGLTIAVGAALLHARLLTLPPLGRDAWRQTDVLIVGRNFCEEQTPLWLPRVDARGDTTGITGMEFPLLNWIEGKLACLGWNQVLVGRTLTLLFSMLAVVCIAELARSLPGRSTPWLAALTFAASPIIWFYGVAIQPDVPSLALMLLSLVLLQHGDRRVTFLASAALASLAILIKLPVIVLGLPAAVIVVQRQGWRPALRSGWSWLYAAMALLPAMAWYRHARHLQEQYGLHTFFLGKTLGELVADWTSVSLYRSVFLEKLFDVYAFPLMSLLAVLLFLLQRRLAPSWLKALGLASLAYVFLTGLHTEHHFYYGTPLIPVIALGSAVFADNLLGRTPERWRGAMTMLLALAITGYGIYRDRAWWPAPESESPFLKARATLDRTVPAGQLTVISGGSPVLLWELHRKGWVSPPVDIVSWLDQTPRTPAVGIDWHDKSVRDVKSMLFEHLHTDGYAPLVQNDTLDLWVRP